MNATLKGWDIEKRGILTQGRFLLYCCWNERKTSLYPDYHYIIQIYLVMTGMLIKYHTEKNVDTQESLHIMILLGYEKSINLSRLSI